MLQKLIEVYEEIKKYVYIVNRGNKKPLIIQFNNENFYHLAGLHKLNIDMFFPEYIKSKSKRYKFMKNNIKKFNNILENQIKKKNNVLNRITTFKYILDLLLSNTNANLYKIEKIPFSLYNGDYGLNKRYKNNYCLLGLKVENENKNVKFCVPQSWMASDRPNNLIYSKRFLYMKEILKIPIWLYNSF